MFLKSTQPMLFVTSFDMEMFVATGATLLLSFLDFVPDCSLLICHEGFAPATVFRHSRLLSYDLGDASLLRQWLDRNRDIIPRHLGGAAEACNCAGSANAFGNHRT